MLKDRSKFEAVCPNNKTGRNFFRNCDAHFICIKVYIFKRFETYAVTALTFRRCQSICHIAFNHRLRHKHAYSEIQTVPHYLFLEVQLVDDRL